MADWIFQATPERYRVLDAIAELDEIVWEVNQHRREIHPRDRVFIWKAGQNAGVYAIAEVLSEPSEMSGGGDPYWQEAAQGDASLPRLRVRVRVRDRLLERPLLRSDLLNEGTLKNLSILRFTQGTNFPVTPEETERLLELAGIGISEGPVLVREEELDVAEVHLRQALARTLDRIEPGLKAYFEERVEEYPVPGGRIDLLCKDTSGRPVVIELKRHSWDVDKAVGQIVRYMGWARRTLAEGVDVRGILLLLSEGLLDSRLEDAKAAVPGLEIKRYSVSIHVE